MHEPGYLEPWLRGPAEGLHPGNAPVIAHLLRASEHIQEDATVSLRDLKPRQIWAKPHGLTSAGFHAKHMSGSTNRLCTYLEGASLSAADIAAIPEESAGEEPADRLIQAIGKAFSRYEAIVCSLKPEDFGSLRSVGRKQIPVTAVSLAIHIVEHGQRHVGQLIAAAKLTRTLHG